MTTSSMSKITATIAYSDGSIGTFAHEIGPQVYQICNLDFNTVQSELYSWPSFRAFLTEIQAVLPDVVDVSHISHISWMVDLENYGSITEAYNTKLETNQTGVIEDSAQWESNTPMSECLSYHPSLGTILLQGDSPDPGPGGGAISYSGSPFTWNEDVVIIPASVTNTGGSATYAVISGALPLGVSLNSASGQLTGTPVVQEPGDVTIRATYADLSTADIIITATVVEALAIGEQLWINADGRTATLSSVLNGAGWDTGANFREDYFDQQAWLTLLVDSGGADERLVSALVRNAYSGEAFSTVTTADDTVQRTNVALPRKISRGESVEVFYSYGSIFTDGTNNSVAIAATTSVANNSLNVSTTPSVAITVKTPPGIQGPCVVTSYIDFLAGDLDAGDNSLIQECEITWWLTGTGLATLPDKYRKVDDPDATRNASQVDYTSDGNFLGMCCGWVLTPGDYTINCRVRNQSGATATATQNVAVAADGRTVVTVNSAGGADETSLATAITNNAGSDNIRIVVEGDHNETISAALVFADDNWIIEWDGTGTKPDITQTANQMVTVTSAVNTVLYGINFIPATAGTQKAVKINGNLGAAFNAIVGCDFNGVSDSTQFSDVLHLGESEDVVLLNNTCVAQERYALAAAGGADIPYNQRIFTIGNDLGISDNESCWRTTGSSWMYFASAYSSYKADAKTTMRLTACGFGSTFCDVAEGYGTGNWSLHGIAERGPSVIRIDSTFLDDAIPDFGNAGGNDVCIVNSINSGQRWNGNMQGVDARDLYHNFRLEHCSITNNQPRSTRFNKGVAVGNDRLAGLRLYGNASDSVAESTSQLSVSFGVEDSLHAKFDYNVWDDDQSPANPVQLDGSDITLSTWNAKAYVSNESLASVAFNANWTMVTPVGGVPVLSTTRDYYGNVRSGTSNAGAVTAAPA